MNTERKELVEAVMMRLGGIKRLMQGQQYHCKYGEVLTGAHVSILFAVKHHNKSVQSHVLAESLAMTPGGISQLLEKLIADGFLSKKPSDSDRRSFDIELTKKGRELTEHIVDKRYVMLQKTTSEFSEKELISFVSLLDKLTAALQEKNG